MIDLHCHLDLYKDPHDIVKRCAELRLYVLSVTTVPSAFEGTDALTANTARIRTALGLHPELAAKRMHEISMFERLINRTRYVGEVGLDGSKDHRSSLDQQSAVLTDILKICTHAGGRIISLHSRGATGIILDLISAHMTAGKFILHWYLGNTRQVAYAVEMGCWFSVNPTMLMSLRGQAVAAAMPRDRVLPESDGPFGVVNGQPIFPWQAWSIVPFFANIWREPEKNVEAQFLSNFKRLTIEEKD